MKVSIVVQDDAGAVFRGEMVLMPDGAGKPAPLAPAVLTAAAPPSSGSLETDFELPVRAFIKKYASGKSGPEKFALLLGRMTKGDASSIVPASDLQSEWNSMTALMGKYNTAYPTRAKERGWIDTPKYGSFTILPGWTEAVGENAR
jgi:hypothetical protein